MKAVVQRVTDARVEVDNETVGEIGPGLVILLGVHHDDTEKEARWLADKCANLRIFRDQQQRMNRSVQDIGGEIMVVSQFTLYGDCAKGRRPSFVEAAPPEISDPLYQLFSQVIQDTTGLKVATGIFAADMRVSLTNDGPVTIILEKNA